MSKDKFDKPYRVPEFHDKNKENKLFELVQYSDINEIIQHAQQNKVLLNSANVNGNNLIHELILNDTLKEDLILNSIKILVNNNVNPDCPNQYNQTPLHLACEKQYESIVNYLLSLGVNPNYQDNIRQTPLHYACVGLIEYVSISEDNGVDGSDGDDVDIVYTNSLSNTVSGTKIRKINKTILQLLLTHGSNIYINDMNNICPLFILIKNYNYKELEFLKTEMKIDIKHNDFIKYIENDIDINWDLVSYTPNGPIPYSNQHVYFKIIDRCKMNSKFIIEPELNFLFTQMIVLSIYHIFYDNINMTDYPNDFIDLLNGYDNDNGEAYFKYIYDTVSNIYIRNNKLNNITVQFLKRIPRTITYIPIIITRICKECIYKIFSTILNVDSTDSSFRLLLTQITNFDCTKNTKSNNIEIMNNIIKEFFENIKSRQSDEVLNEITEIEQYINSFMSELIMTCYIYCENIYKTIMFYHNQIKTLERISS